MEGELEPLSLLIGLAAATAAANLSKLMTSLPQRIWIASLQLPFSQRTLDSSR